MSSTRDLRLHFAGVALTLVAWQVFIPADSVYLPPLSAVLETYRDLVSSGRLFEDACASLARVASGVAIAASLATGLAVISSLVPRLGELLNGPLEIVRPVPPIAWIPLSMLLFGIGEKPAIAIVALGSFFPIWMGLRFGLAAIRLEHIQAARSLGASKVRCLFDVVAPSVMPSAIHGFRSGVGLGLFCVVAAEMMGSQSGLGYGIHLFSMNLQIAEIYCYLLTIGLIGLCLNIAIMAAENRVCHWHRLDAGMDAALD